MGPHQRELLRLIHENALDRPPHIDRYPEIAQLIASVTAGKLREYQARMYIPAVTDLINEITILPNVTVLPDSEKLCADGPFDVELGTTENGLRYGTRLKPVTHALIAGATGTGKSVLVRNFIIKLSHHLENTGKKTSIIVIDPKADYRDLPLKAAGQWMVLDAGTTLRLGTQPPPCVPWDAWVNTLSTCLAARCGLIAGRVSISQVLRWLRVAMQDHLGMVDCWPSWQLVYEVLRYRQLWATKEEYAKSGEQNLADLVESTGHLFSTFRGFDVSRQVISQGKNAVIAMERNTLPWIGAIVCDTIIGNIFLSLLFSGHKSDETVAILVVDESDEFISRHQELNFPNQISPSGLIATKGRELGIKAVFVVRVLSTISPWVIADAMEMYILNQANPESILEARRSLLLPSGGEQMIANLKPGEAIARQALSSWPHATLLKVDFVSPHRGAPLPCDTHPYTPSKSLEEMPELRKLLEEKIAEHDQDRRARKPKKNFSEAARKLLAACFSLPYWPVARLWERAGQVSPSTQKAVRKELETGGLAKFEEIRIARKNVLLMLPTQAASELLACQLPAYRGRGGVAHIHLQNWITMVGKERGHEAVCEWRVPDTSHPVDAVWQIDGRSHAFEVIHGCKTNIPTHIHACLVESRAVETLTIVTSQIRQRGEVRAQVESQFVLSPVLGRIRFEVISTYVEELWP